MTADDFRDFVAHFAGVPPVQVELPELEKSPEQRQAGLRWEAVGFRQVGLHVKRICQEQQAAAGEVSHGVVDIRERTGALLHLFQEHRAHGLNVCPVVFGGPPPGEIEQMDEFQRWFVFTFPILFFLALHHALHGPARVAPERLDVDGGRIGRGGGWEFKLNQASQIGVAGDHRLDDGDEVVAASVRQDCLQIRQPRKGIRVVDPGQQQGHDVLAEAATRAGAGIGRRVGAPLALGMQGGLHHVRLVARTFAPGLDGVALDDSVVNVAPAEVGSASAEAPAVGHRRHIGVVQRGESLVVARHLFRHVHPPQAGASEPPASPRDRARPVHPSAREAWGSVRGYPPCARPNRIPCHAGSPPPWRG